MRTLALSLRARLLLAIVAVNLAAFSALAVAVLQDDERREDSRQILQERINTRVVDQFAELFLAFFRETVVDPENRPPAEILEQGFWSYARDAYITNRPIRIGERIVPGDVELNPVGVPGAPAAAAERLPPQALELLARAYAEERPLRQREILAIPIYSERPGAFGSPPERMRWGAAYVRVDVPELPPLEAGLDLRFLVLALGGATLLAAGIVYLLLHVLVLDPLARVSRGALRVSGGDLAAPVPGTGRGDELDELIATFNAMTREIGEARRALEERVAEAVSRARESEQRLVLAERLAALGTLAAGIAHEINNPLGGMQNAIRSLRRRQGADSAADRYLMLVEDGLGRIGGVVQRVLRMSRSRGGAGRASLAQVVEDAAGFIRHRAVERGAVLEIDVPADLAVRGDAAELGQVFLNLLLNALDALDPDAGRERRIAVRARREGGWARVTVEDTGRGMDERTRQRAFDLFFTTKEAGAGTGLGLSIAHRIVSEHGGTLEVSSEAGRGTTFVLRIPAV